MISELIIKYLLAPLIVEVLVRFIDRRATDPEFKKRSDEIWGKVGSASSLDERRESAKDIQKLINS